VDRAEYAVIPYYVWQKPRVAPQYRHTNLRLFYTDVEARDFKLLHSFWGVLAFYAKKVDTTVLFFAGFLLLPPLVMFRHVLRDRRVRFFARSLPFWAVGMGVGIYLIPHYVAPFTGVAYVFGLQCMRHLRAAKYGGTPVGRRLVTALIVGCVSLAGLRAFAQPLGLSFNEVPIGLWECSWVGPDNFGVDRANVTAQLEKLPGSHLVLVRYSPGHNAMDEWVYNVADIDASRIIWAQDMGPAANVELIQHYHDRDVWLVEPDVQHGRPVPYVSPDI
jgi:hypothetical protein